jgi:hypothetical protein
MSRTRITNIFRGKEDMQSQTNAHQLWSKLIATAFAATLLAGCGGGGSSGTGTANTTSNAPVVTSATTATVTGFTATPAHSTVTLRWDAMANATGYQVQSSTDASFATGTSLLLTNSTSYTYNNLTNGTTYYYRILAEYGTQNSAYSTSISATPNYLKGWNSKVAIANIGGATLAQISSRNDDMNANRDALSSWSYGSFTYGYTAYAAMYSKATDWTSSVIISNNGMQTASSLSDNGEAAVAWVERTITPPPAVTAYVDSIRVKHYQGGNWSASAIPLSGTESGNYASFASIKLDKFGNAVAAWRGTNGNFYVSTYNRTANTWAAPMSLNTVANPYAHTVRIGVDGNGVFVLAWDEPTLTSVNNTNRIFLRKFSQAGGWSVTETLNLDNPALNYFNGVYSLSVNTNGDIFVLWGYSTSTIDNQLIFRRYSAASATWSTPVTVDSSNFSLSSATIKANASGNAVLFWNKTVNNGGTTAASLNLAVYTEATGTFSLIEQMPYSVYPIGSGGMDVATDAANSFRAFYGYNDGTAVHAYERDYNPVSQTWGAPTTAVQYLGYYDYIATTNSVGEIMLSASSSIAIQNSFYLP